MKNTFEQGTFAAKGLQAWPAADRITSKSTRYGFSRYMRKALMIASSIALVLSASSYTLSFDDGDGEGSMGNVSSESEREEEECSGCASEGTASLGGGGHRYRYRYYFVLPPCRLTNPGYEFGGWLIYDPCRDFSPSDLRSAHRNGRTYYGPYKVGTWYWASCNIRAIPYWIKKVTYIIRFHRNNSYNDGATAGRTVSMGASISLPTISSLGWTRTGYDFVGWGTYQSDSYADYMDGERVKDLATSNGATVHLYAIWQPRPKHVMTLYRNNSSGDGAGARRTVTDDAYYTLPTIASLGWTRSGYTFKGWATYRGGSVEYGDGEHIYVSWWQDSLYAVWEEVRSRHVMTLFRNNSGGDGAGARRTVTDEAYYTLPTISSLGWTRSGYTFKGWATSHNATSASYSDGARIYVGSGLYSLYAVWDNRSRHVMTLFRNNSSGDGAGARRTVTDDAYYTLPTISSLGWTRSGYTFKGWATSHNATSASYSDGARIYVGSGLYSLYAVWERGGGGGIYEPVLGRDLLTGGDADWYEQSRLTHDGISALRSGHILHNQSTYIQTTVTSASSVSFWWKVSSESGCDRLRFYIDGNEQANISGSPQGWEQKTYSLSSGIHTLKWAYTKDRSVDTGTDCGWVDQIEIRRR